MEYRIGQGLDVHAFAEGDHVMLGAVRIPHSQGLVAHSDGDVALHALCDAFLGAVALGDIGQHFPPADEQWRDADSSTLLASVNEMLRQDGWHVINLCSTALRSIVPPFVALIANTVWTTKEAVQKINEAN